MALSWSEVQSGSDSVTVGLGDGGHGNLFGNVLADQAVEILVGSPFPGVVRGGEVALQREALLELFVSMEFGAVVEGDCLEAGFVLADGLQGGVCNRVCGPRRQLFNDGETGFSLNKSEDAVMAIDADHSVSLPMTELQTGFDYRRPLGDMTLAGQNSA